MPKHCRNRHFLNFLNQIWPKGTLIVALHILEDARVRRVKSGSEEVNAERNSTLEPVSHENQMLVVRWDKIDYPDTDQWGSFKAQQKLHFKAFFHAVH